MGGTLAGLTRGSNAGMRETLGEYNLDMAELRSTAKRVTEMKKKVEEQENSMEEAINLEIKRKGAVLVKLFEEKKARSEQKLGEVKTKSLESPLDESKNELFEVRLEFKTSLLNLGEIKAGED